MEQKIYVLEYCNYLTPLHAILIDSKVFANKSDAIKHFKKECKELKKFRLLKLQVSDAYGEVIKVASWYINENEKISILRVKETNLL
jgi:hypothetical protein